MSAVAPDFEKLFQQAKELLEAHPAAEQAVVARTAGGAVRCLANHGVTSGSTEDENAFVEALAESGDTRVLRMVCLWRTAHTLDVPSMNLRKALLELDPANRETELLLCGEEWNVMSIGRTMPGKSKQG